MPDAQPRLIVEEGDLATYPVDAIVNAANESLAPGGGVCGAIHRRAGPELAAACAQLARCPTGEARLTPGFRLPARFVIHAVGPIWRGGDHGEDELLGNCYRAVAAIVRRENFRAVAIPAISTGIYGFPPDRAARIALTTTAEALAGYDATVTFVAFGAKSLADLSAARVALKS
jgi:O-acetyl-ADP-ribose deacetylase